MVRELALRELVAELPQRGLQAAAFPGGSLAEDPRTAPDLLPDLGGVGEKQCVKVAVPGL